jgi:hypothetical protein
MQIAQSVPESDRPGVDMVVYIYSKRLTVDIERNRTYTIAFCSIPKTDLDPWLAEKFPAGGLAHELEFCVAR